jgi:hypothetical protein
MMGLLAGVGFGPTECRSLVQAASLEAANDFDEVGACGRLPPRSQQTHLKRRAEWSEVDTACTCGISLV